MCTRYWPSQPGVNFLPVRKKGKEEEEEERTTRWSMTRADSMKCSCEPISEDNTCSLLLYTVLKTLSSTKYIVHILSTSCVGALSFLCTLHCRWKGNISTNVVSETWGVFSVRPLNMIVVSKRHYSGSGYSREREKIRIFCIEYMANSNNIEKGGDGGRYINEVGIGVGARCKRRTTNSSRFSINTRRRCNGTNHNKKWKGSNGARRCNHVGIIDPFSMVVPPPCRHTNPAY